MNKASFPSENTVDRDLLQVHPVDAIARLNRDQRNDIWLRTTANGNRFLLSDPAARQYGIERGYVGVITSLDRYASPQYDLLNPVAVPKPSKEEMMKDLRASGFTRSAHFVDLTDHDLYKFWKQQCRPTPEPAKPVKLSKPKKPGKHVVTGNPGETLVALEVFERVDTSKPMKRTPPIRSTSDEVVYLRLEKDRKLREATHRK